MMVLRSDEKENWKWLKVKTIQKKRRRGHELALKREAKTEKRVRTRKYTVLSIFFFYPILLFGKEMGITQQKPKTQFFSKSNGLDPVPNPFSLESLSLSLFKKKKVLNLIQFHKLFSVV